MGFTERRTIARFLLQDGAITRTVDVEAPPGERDPSCKVIEQPNGALGVSFIDQVVAEVEDPATGDPIICCSAPLWKSAGTFYFRGLVATEDDIRAGRVSFPTLVHQNIQNQMVAHEWNLIIYFEGGQLFLPFNPKVDLAPNAIGMFQMQHALPPDGIIGPITLGVWMYLGAD